MTTPKQTLAERRAAISEGVRLSWQRRKSRTKQGPEQALQRLLLDYLTAKYRGRLVLWRNNTGATATASGGFVRYGAVGSPDLLGILSPSGRLVGLEVKAPGGKATPAQLLWLTEARSHGALCGVVHSLDEAIALLDGGLA
jgi:hypothetical protein